MNLIQNLVQCFESDAVFYTGHAKFEMAHEVFGRIYEHEVYEAIGQGEIIEEYPKDKPYPSALIFGKTATDRPLHIVCAYNQKEKLTIIITVYHPNPEQWIEFKRRKRL